MWREQKHSSVSDLANYFNQAGTQENSQSKRYSSGYGSTTDTETILEEEVIKATFEKQVGKIQDFQFVYGKSSRGTTGLFIKDVHPGSPLAGSIMKEDQLTRVNDEDVKDSEKDLVRGILYGLSGTVELEVIRIKGIAKQDLEERKPVERHSLFDNPTWQSETINSNKDRRRRQLKEMALTKSSVKMTRSLDQHLQQTNDKGEQMPSSQSQHRRMATRTSQKSIDDIKSFRDMLELFRLLQIDNNDDYLDLQEMKKTAKQKIQEQSSGSGQYSNGITGFSVISKSKKEDMLKRKKLENYYSKLDDCLKQIDKDDNISILNTSIGDRDILKVHDEQKNRLGKIDYYLLVAGQSSSGKSSLLNLILGEELLPHHVLNATSTICELKYGKVQKLVVHYKYDKDQKVKTPSATIELKTKEQCGYTYQQQIASFVYLDQKDREKGSDYDKVELFWPHELLQEGVVIVDSPGIGESNDMDQVLMNYLPNAFAFIYVIDITRAGGLQKDFKEKLMKILGKLQLLEGGTEQYNRLAECSLFVCNKWDQVPEGERNKVRANVVQQLSDCWQDAIVNNQIVYISATEAIKAQQYGGVTTEFYNLLESIKQMILKAINIRLYNHWQWLDLALYHIFKLTDFFVRETQSDHQTTRERMNFIASRIKNIEHQQQKVVNEINGRLNHQAKFFNSKLVEFVKSSEFETKFCKWTADSFPPKGDTWAITKSNIKKAIQDRFQQFLIQWEGENRILSDFHKQIADEFLARLNLLKEELEGVENDRQSVERQADYLKNRSQLSTGAKIFVGATSPLWIPLGIAGFVVSIPVVTAIAVKNKLSEKRKLDNYTEDPYDFLKQRSRKFLDRGYKMEEAMSKYAKEQMTKIIDILSTYVNMIPRVIEADKKMVSQLLSETRSQDEVLEQYDPIRTRIVEVRKEITHLGIELCPTSVDESGLDWKKDFCIGEGEFSRVYRGRLKNGGRNRALDSNAVLNVAVKLFKQPFDHLNSRFYLNEEMKIRSLDHKNVLAFFGAIKVNNSHISKDCNFVFVTKLCQENLRSVIFNDKRITPSIAEHSKQAIDTFLKWVIEIAEGLSYIHERGLIHRHLKLENILVDEHNTAMIGDIGIVGKFKKIEKSIIYIAPEVLQNLENCTKAADIYSYGIMLWEMWYGTHAFQELMPLVKEKFQEKITGGHRPMIDDKTISCPGIHSYMSLCWMSNADERPSAKECSNQFKKF